jgi:hypothetical protein
MAIQSFEMPENHGHLLGDVPALIVVAAALAALMRIDFFRLTYRSAAVPRSFHSASCCPQVRTFAIFSLRPEQVVLASAAGLLVQRGCWRLNPSKPRSNRSAVITCLSLTLLLRADSLFAHPAAAAAILSKSMFRFGE